MSGLAVVAIASLISLPASSRAVASGCPNFTHYATAPLSSVDADPWLDPAVKPIVKIDRQLRPNDLEAAYQCVVRRNLAVLREIFGADQVAVDAEIYQFAASEFAYGRVLVNNSSYAGFLRETLMANTTLVKINFDFDASGTVVDQDIFAISNRSGELEYSELKLGKMAKTSRCLQCHRESEGTSVFFKKRYTGLRHSATQPPLDFRDKGNTNIVQQKDPSD